ncbi:MAG: BspA family leucine-rich repeat surface protein [Bacteroidota bacterium]|nr:BspA family leucine-rich repeat surface protein [Bacteroidota bacterium]
MIKKITQIGAIIVFIIGMLKAQAQPFVTEWNLTIPGSGSTQLTFGVETAGTVNYNWATIPIATLTGSGTFTGIIASITGLPANSRISLSITSTNFRRFNMNNGADAIRLTNIVQWGNTAWTSMSGAFAGCGFISGRSAVDSPNLSNVTDMAYMFQNSSFNQPIGHWNVSNITNMSFMFNSNTSFNQTLGGWNISNVVFMQYMFYNASAFNQPLGSWGTKLNPNVILDVFIENSGINGFNYDNLLNGFSATSVTGRIMGAVGINYCSAGSARSTLTSSKGWTISDAGIATGSVSITTQPLANAYTCIGQMYTFSVTGNGSKLGYIWSNNQSFTNTMTTSVLGTYFVDITGTCGTVRSNPAILNNGFPNIFTQPTSEAICSGNSANLLVLAQGAGLNYKWSSGETTTGISKSVSGIYQATVTGSCGIAVSNPATVQVNFSTAITTQPISIITTSGVPITFSVSATGSNLSYMWSNGLSTTHQISTSIPGTYFVTVSGSCGKVISNPAHLNSEFVTIWDLAQIGSGPNSLGLDVNSSGLVSYRWETFPVSTLSGSGTFFGNSLAITGLPTDQKIRLRISPVNFNQFWFSQSFERLRLIDIQQWGTTVWQTMNSSFSNCTNLTSITASDIPNLSQATSLASMFSGCENLSFIPNIGSWEISNVTNLSYMFTYSSFNQSIGGWNTTNVTDMSYLFSRASQFNQPIGNWNTTNVTNMANMFEFATLFNQSISGWNTANVTNMSYMFSGTNNFNQSIGGWNTSNVTDMSFMFAYNSGFNRPIGNWNTNNVVNMSSMFQGANAFNQPINNWNTSNVTNMSNMFANGSEFDQPIGNWNTSNVTNMSGMFSYNSKFNHSIAGWNTSNVSDMNGMFSYNSKFNQAIDSWNTSNVTNMNGMFRNTSSFNQPIGNWNISNVTDMSAMFFSSSSFNQNLGAWGTKLNPNVNLGSFLEYNTSIDGLNYGAFLQGLNAGTVTGRSLGATLVKYCSGVTDRKNLITNKAWTITDGGPGTGIIVTQPLANTTICSGVIQNFSVSATGIGLSYNWSNGGSTTRQMSTSIPGTYYVTVSGGTCGAVASNAIQLTQAPSTSIASQPLVSATICSGLVQNFSVSALGANLTYSWSTGSTSNDINTSTPGVYLITISGLCGSVVSNPSTLSVLPATTIVSSNIADASICSGITKNYAVSANGSNLSYAWSNGLTASNINTSTAGNYMVTVNGTCGTAVSNAATLTVNEKTSIAKQPSSQTVCSGNSALFAISALGQNLSYSWSNGAANASLMSTSAAGTYAVTISGTCGQAISTPFSLVTSVCSSPIISIAIIFPKTTTGTFTGVSANIIWPTLTGAITYCIRYSKTSDFSTTTNVKTICGLTAANYLFVLSTAGLRIENSKETIYYQVAGVDANGNISLWSETQSIELVTEETTSLEVTAISKPFNIYPNPTSGSFTIQGFDKLSQTSIVEVFNAQGTLVYSQKLVAETNVVNASLPKGIYFVKIGSELKELVVQE